jgi:hypothetical protein
MDCRVTLAMTKIWRFTMFPWALGSLLRERQRDHAQPSSWRPRFPPIVIARIATGNGSLVPDGAARPQLQAKVIQPDSCHHFVTNPA